MRTPVDAATIAENAIGLFLEECDRRGIDFESSSLGEAKAAAIIEVVQGVEADVPEGRPFVRGESVYVVGAPGEVAPTVRVIDDLGVGLRSGEDVVETTQGLVRARFVRRDRRGARLPGYADGPLTDEEKQKRQEEGPWL